MFITIHLSFFITYFANLFIKNCWTHCRERHIQSPIKDLRCSFWKKIFHGIEPRGVFRTQQNIYDRAFCKISWQLSVANSFHKKLHLICFDSLLNMPLDLLTISEKNFRHPSDMFEERQNNCKLCEKGLIFETLQVKT